MVGCGVHFGYIHPDKNLIVELFGEDILVDLYCEDGMSVKSVGDELGVSYSAVLGALEHLNVERRVGGHPSAPYPIFLTDANGYERWEHWNGNEQEYVRVHRLLMTLELDDISELEGMDVHHKNGISWDNRLENLELHTHSEHAKHHSFDRDREEGRFT